MTSKIETALRTKMRFASSKGPLSLEQLWDVPLRSNDGFNLNSIAKTLNLEVKGAAEENFVDSTRRAPALTRAETALEIVKHVINTLLTEEAEAQDRALRREKKNKLLEVLSKKQDEKLGGMSEAQIKRALDELDD